MVQIQAKDLTLHEVKEKFGLKQAEDEQFFGEWIDDLPELTDLEMSSLDRVKADYLYLAEYPMPESLVKMLVLSPLISLAGFYRPPFRVTTEAPVRIAAEDEGEIIQGRIDILVIQKQLWVLVIESKQAGFSLKLGIPQALAYMMANLNTGAGLKLIGMDNSRQLAFVALSDVHKGAYADVALDRVLRQANLSAVDRRLVTELVYGSVRRLRSLDALIDQLAKKKAHQQPPYLRTILHLGLYQLRYQERIPVSAAVNSTVELAKENGFLGLTGFVNGLLRQYIRLAQGKESELVYPTTDPLQLPENPVERLGILYSYPDWIIKVWLEQLGLAETEQLCAWLNQPPVLDLRVNPLRTSIHTLAAAIQSTGVAVSRVPHLPQALRLVGSTGQIQNLPGFNEGWWTVQDSSAQLVGYLLDPQPGEVVIDACAAPGGKTTHIAELMQDNGTIWACDRTASRLRKLRENAMRLQLQSIQICLGDSRNSEFKNADRLLLDVPCSGLGTLHRHADARWRQTPESVQELSLLQAELLSQTSTYVKLGGIVVYATCTLHPLENEGVIHPFLAQHPNWQVEPPLPDSPAFAFATPEGFVKVLPHRHSMDGFFMVRLRKNY